MHKRLIDAKNTMEKQFILKVIVPDSFDEGFFTIYIFNEEGKIIIPIKTNTWGCESVLLSKQKKKQIHPHIHDTLMRSVIALGGNVLCAMIYKVIDDAFYTYLRILKNNEILDINIRATDAISIALRCDKPILVSESVYKEVGIKVTKELLRRSLEL